MAIYHLEAKVVSRGAGRSAVAAAAYLSCSRLLNEYDGVQHDYTRKQGLVWQQVFLPVAAPAEWQNREILWNAVEENEKTKDSRLAREFVVALPIELSKAQWERLLSDFVSDTFVSDGMCADVAIHDPYPPGHNPHLERAGQEERIDHRSHAERGLEEQPTIHEGVIARALEKKGIVSDRCELNRQIKADNALLRELRGQVRKLAQSVKNNLPALAEAMENLRKNLLMFCYQLGYLRKGKERLSASLDTLHPALAQYNQLAKNIRDKTKERRNLISEKKALSAVHVFQHRELAAKIAALTEDLEELRSEKNLLLASLEYTEEDATVKFQKDIAAMEQNLKRLEEQEQKYSAELNVALNEYAVLREQVQGVDPVQLYEARQAIRPKLEQDVMCHLQKIYGERYSHIMMERSKRSVALRLHEADEQSCCQKTTLQRSNKQAHHDEGER